jgi:hypothetical protein
MSTRRKRRKLAFSRVVVAVADFVVPDLAPVAAGLFKHDQFGCASSRRQPQRRHGKQCRDSSPPSDSTVYRFHDFTLQQITKFEYE